VQVGCELGGAAASSGAAGGVSPLSQVRQRVGEGVGAGDELHQVAGRLPQWRGICCMVGGTWRDQGAQEVLALRAHYGWVQLQRLHLWQLGVRATVPGWRSLAACRPGRKKDATWSWGSCRLVACSLLSPCTTSSPGPQAQSLASFCCLQHSGSLGQWCEEAPGPLKKSWLLHFAAHLSTRANAVAISATPTARGAKSWVLGPSSAKLLASRKQLQLAPSSSPPAAVIAENSTC
jgi:hypothetical protein